MNVVETGIEEDEMNIDSNLEDPIDKNFMTWSLQEIWFNQQLLSCDEGDNMKHDERNKWVSSISKL